MRKSILRKLLLLVPIVVLGLTLLFVNFAVRTFNDTAYTFVYDTNVQSVQSFSSELSMLASQGFTSAEHEDLYTNMIHNFNNAVGEKDAIVTFLLDDAGQMHHSTVDNEAFLADLLANEANASSVNAAYSARSNGEIIVDNGETTEPMYYHRFYSGDSEYTLFMCVERPDIDAQLNANGVIIPLCVIGLLLLFALEYIIWLKLLCVRCGSCKLGNDSRGSHPAASKPAASEPGGSEPIGD